LATLLRPTHKKCSRSSLMVAWPVQATDRRTEARFTKSLLKPSSIREKYWRLSGCISDIRISAPLLDDSRTARGEYCVVLKQKLAYARDKASTT
jgi:hypothetical protein